MRVALLNLPLDSNYGGNLQRYALIRVLSDLGHDVVHLNTHYVNHSSLTGIVIWWLRQIKNKIMNRHGITLSRETFLAEDDRIRCENAMPFYEKYIPHTHAIYSKKELANYGREFDAYVVGSDQVWRKAMTKSYGLFTYLFDFISAESSVKRIAYAASMGTDINELNEKEASVFRQLYQGFTGVSVREDSALQLLQSYGCKQPQAQVVLDPTMLLTDEDYEKLTANTHTSDGNLFCYILDPDDEKQSFIEEIQKDKGLVPFYNVETKVDKVFSIEQWLRSFMDAEMVVTDSYHGFVFSLIFHKPVKVLFNKRRGNARFSSLAAMLDIDFRQTIYDKEKVAQRIEELRSASISFLKNNLK